ncbi:putative FIP1[III]-like protein [Abeliophyllum distichum]|uniref:FIP1[III]-like protein n=1 Tax=Abeliophyllum distichum TaxID=126358 RepID=A0ABD1VV42_9LAMI
MSNLWPCTLQLSRRRSEAGCTMSYGRHDYMDWNSDLEQETPTGLNDFGSEKAALAKTEKADTNQGDKSWNDKFPDTQQNGYLDIEEEHTGTASNGNTVVHGLDDLRIQEIMAKMEKRRERFKDPITSNKDAVKPSNHLMEFDT